MCLIPQIFILKYFYIYRCLNSFFCLYGAPNKLVSDQGSEFINHVCL